MKKYFRNALVLAAGTLLLGLAGCGSSNNGSNCSNGQVNSQFGCANTCGGNNMITQPGTNSCVANTLASANGSYNCSMYPGTTLQAVPSPYNQMPQFSQTGGQGCCVTMGMGQEECYQPMPNNNYGYGTGGYGSTGTIGGPCPIPGYPAGATYLGGSSCT